MRRPSHGSTTPSLSLVDDIQGLEGYRHFHAARADLLRRSGRTSEAHATYRRALALTGGGPERQFLERRLGETTAESQE
jgi:RNA polymerase sigma-70 factor (ECF subfamily)